MEKRFPAGTSVRLTSDFLRNTGQFTGQDAHSAWVVRECDCDLCESGRFVAINQEYSHNWFTSEEIKRDERLVWRHINVANLERARR